MFGFTATAKPDVVDDICAHFEKRLGVVLERLEGGVSRENLSYESGPCRARPSTARCCGCCRGAAGGRRRDRLCARQKTVEAVAAFSRRPASDCSLFSRWHDADRQAPGAGGFSCRHAAGDRRHQCLRHGRGQARRAPGDPSRHPRSLENYLQGGRPRRARPGAGALSVALRRRRPRGAVSPAQELPPHPARHPLHPQGLCGRSSARTAARARWW